MSTDGKTRLTDRKDILDRWQQHFSELLNRPSTVDQNSIDVIPQSPILHELVLDDAPTMIEIQKAVHCLQNGKAPGEDGIPAEVFKHGGEKLIERVHELFLLIWQDEVIPDQLKDALIVTI